MKTYILNPNMTYQTVTTARGPHKPEANPTETRALQEIAEPIAPAPFQRRALATTLAPRPPAVQGPPVPASVPPRQPLPTPVLHPDRPKLKLGLDVHLEFIMAVVQRDHASAQAPRKFTRAQLVEHVKGWTAEGLAVYCVQES